MWFRASVNIFRRLHFSPWTSDRFLFHCNIKMTLMNTIVQPTKTLCPPCAARFSTNKLSDDQLRKYIDEIGDKFTEARELLDDARESEGTVYFSEDMTEAETAVTETIQNYQSLLSQLDEKQKLEVTRTIGLRMEELKAQLELIQESLKD